MFIRRSALNFYSFELSEMLSISLNSKENKMGVRASYKHFAATRLRDIAHLSRLFLISCPQREEDEPSLAVGLLPHASSSP